MPARPLDQLQEDFTRWLLGEPVAGFEQLVDSRGLAPAQRLQVYRNMLAANHQAALATAYPIVLRLVGDDFFDDLCAAYLQEYPSTSGNLQDYGAQFPELIESHPQAATLDYLADVARLEWARQESVLAPLEDPVSNAIADSVAPDDYENLCFSLVPSLKLVQSDYPILDIWLYCNDPCDSRLDIEGHRQDVVVWRSGTQIAMLAIEPARYRLLSRLADGKPLGTAIETGADDLAADTLRWLFSERLVSGFSL